MKFQYTPIAFVLAFFCSQLSFAQNTFWLNQKVCDTNNFAYTDFTQTNNGNFYMVANYNYWLVPESPYLIKYDKDYNLIWRKSFDADTMRLDHFTKIITLPNDNLLIIGNLESKDGDFAGIDTSQAPNSLFLAELDTNGNIIKSNCLRASGYSNYSDIKIDKYNNIYIAGYTSGNLFDFINNPEGGGFTTNCFLARFDTSLNLKWLKIIDAPGDQDIIPLIAINNLSQIILSTSTNSTLKAGYFTATSPTPNGKMYVSCIDSNQNLIWQKCYGGAVNGNGLYSGPMNLIQDSVNNTTYIVGFSNQKTGDMLDTNDKNPCPSSESIFIINMDSVGNKIYSKRYGAFSANNHSIPCYKSPGAFEPVAILKDSNIFVLSKVLYSDSAFTGFAVDTLQHKDMWLLKLTLNGEILNKLRYGGKYTESFNSININKINNNVIIGNWGTNCSIGNLGAGYSLYEPTETALSISQIEKSNIEFTVYPNPANNSIDVKLQSNIVAKGKINLLDMNGKIVSHINTQNNLTTYQLDTTNLPDGQYIIQIINNNKTTSKKIIINHH
ncbi:MAG: T9SS type A sorting domain-containing protein [Chitinophagaceae bacterium]